MEYEINDRVGIATFNWFTGDSMQYGVVAGHCYNGCVIVRIDGDENEDRYREFDTIFGHELGTLAPRVLIHQDHLDEIESELRQNFLARGLKKFKVVFKNLLEETKAASEFTVDFVHGKHK